jgi:hypothetical protein
LRTATEIKKDFAPFLPDFAQRSTENRVLRIVFNTDLRCGHDGLYKIAKNLKVMG